MNKAARLMLAGSFQQIRDNEEALIDASNPAAVSNAERRFVAIVLCFQHPHTVPLGPVPGIDTRSPTNSEATPDLGLILAVDNDGVVRGRAAHEIAPHPGLV